MSGDDTLLFIHLFVIPSISVMCFLNFVSLLKNLKAGKSIHNQTILGAVLCYILFMTLMIGLEGMY
jgi:hypothetical protein